MFVWLNINLKNDQNIALPTDIPIPKESKYNFSNFSLDADWTTDIGKVGAVNQELEIEAVVDVFETWIEKYPGDIILEKWVDDTLEAARGLIVAAGKALLKSSHQLNDHLDIEFVLSGLKTPNSPPINRLKGSKKKKTKIIESDMSVMHLYRDAELIPAKGKGGAKVDPLMDLISVNTYLKSNPQKMIVRLQKRNQLSNGKICHQPFLVASTNEAPDKPDMEKNNSELDVTDSKDIAEDGSKKVDSFDGEAFDAASIINLDSTKLVDVLADKDLAPTALKNTITLLLASTLVQEKVLTEADWDMT
ncbi:hypothetical protein F4604DRAFT_1680712 [Suillus subluteus]|nr:hypothetical protein F4604DRAFT_1680712 [Suillus subluteus]